MNSGKRKIILWAGMPVFAVIALATIGAVHYFHKHIPAEIVPDLRAAIAARHVADPDARVAKYLEGLYGPLDQPANREHLFEDFFNASHIRAMELLTSHSPAAQRTANIQAMARWVSNYRQSMLPEEKAALAAYFQSGAGQSALQSATAQFMNQDAAYRSATVPVITELMTTLAKVKQ